MRASARQCRSRAGGSKPCFAALCAYCESVPAACLSLPSAWNCTPPPLVTIKMTRAWACTQSVLPKDAGSKQEQPEHGHRLQLRVDCHLQEHQPLSQALHYFGATLRLIFIARMAILHLKCVEVEAWQKAPAHAVNAAHASVVSTVAQASCIDTTGGAMPRKLAAHHASTLRTSASLKVSGRGIGLHSPAADTAESFAMLGVFGDAAVEDVARDVARQQKAAS